MWSKTLFQHQLTIVWILFGIYFIGNVVDANPIEESSIDQAGSGQFIKLTLLNGNPGDIFERSLHAEQVSFTAKVESNPANPTLQWFKETEQLNNTNKHRIVNEDQQSTLNIMNPARSDNGYYILEGKTANITEKLNITLMIVEQPEVRIEANTSAMYISREPFSIKCLTEGCPTPKITWHWSPCFSPGNCPRNYQPMNHSQENEEEVLELTKGISENCGVESILRGVAYSAGVYSCKAENSVGRNFSESPVFIHDFTKDFDAVTSQNELFEDQSLQLNCYASKFHYVNVEWFWLPVNNRSENDTVMKVTDNLNTLVRQTETLYTYFTEIQINSISLKNSGQFICRATRLEEKQTDEKFIQIQVLSPSIPVIMETNMNNGSYSVVKDQYFDFVCRADGVPQPYISWYLNGTLIRPSAYGPFRLNDNGTQLRIVRVLAVDTGIYTCTASNNVGSSMAMASLTVLDANTSAASKMTQFMHIYIAHVIMVLIVIMI